MDKECVYKIVGVLQNKNGTRSKISCVTHDEEVTLTYVKGKWIYPRIEGSRVFVFKGLEDAKIALGEYWDWSSSRKEIWKCEFRGKIEERGIISHSSMMSSMITFWKYGKVNGFKVSCSKHKSTVNAVKLIERVW
jgi:hypothetical protein